MDVLLSLPVGRAGSGGSEQLKKHHASIVKGIGSAKTHFVIICPPESRHGLEKLYRAADSAITLIEGNVPEEAAWAQDSSLLVRSDSRSTLVANPKVAESPAWTDALRSAADLCNLDFRVAPFPFSGGNILQGHGPTIVGADLIKRLSQQQSRCKTIGMLEALFRSEILVVGTDHREETNVLGPLHGLGFQPLFHIDMFVSRTGVQGLSGKEVVFLGHPEEAHDVLGRWESAETKALNDTTQFSKCEQQLAGLFEVHRLPLLAASGTLGKTSNPRRTYAITFANCVIDANTSFKKVLLPSFHPDSFLYGTDATVRMEAERAACAAWTQLGFQVSFSSGVEDLAYYGGGLRCLSKVLRDKPTSSRNSFSQCGKQVLRPPALEAVPGFAGRPA